jgi:dihydrofolate reductase
MFRFAPTDIATGGNEGIRRRGEPADERLKMTERSGGCMKKVILSMMVSLDGRISGVDGDLGWFRTDDDFEREMLTLLRSVDGILLGRVSYELLAGYWPSAGTFEAGSAPGGFTSKEREIAFAQLMNSIPKTVYSKTLTQPAWGPARAVSDHVAEDVVRMKREPGKDLVLFAGASLATTFINLDLIDEFRLMVHPVVLAEGPQLFKDIREVHQLKLARTKAFTSGVVLLQHVRDRLSRRAEG